MEMIKGRNLTVHAYDQSTADQIASTFLLHYVGEFGQMEQRFQRIKEETS